MRAFIVSYADDGCPWESICARVARSVRQMARDYGVSFSGAVLRVVVEEDVVVYEFHLEMGPQRQQYAQMISRLEIPK